MRLLEWNGGGGPAQNQNNTGEALAEFRTHSHLNVHSKIHLAMCHPSIYEIQGGNLEANEDWATESAQRVPNPATSHGADSRHCV
jgi:hypothetical protein